MHLEEEIPAFVCSIAKKQFHFVLEGKAKTRLTNGGGELGISFK